MERLKLETIENIIKTHRTVVEVLENENIDDDYDLSLDKCIIYGMEELKQYRIAEEQGLLLRLPCEIGDKVFVIPSRVNYKLNVLNKHPELNRIYEQEVNSIQIYNNGSYLLTTCDGWCNVTSTTYRENWFITKEEAEQALAKMKEV